MQNETVGGGNYCLLVYSYYTNQGEGYEYFSEQNARPGTGCGRLCI